MQLLTFFLLFLSFAELTMMLLQWAPTPRKRISVSILKIW